MRDSIFRFVSLMSEQGTLLTILFSQCCGVSHRVRRYQKPDRLVYIFRLQFYMTFIVCLIFYVHDSQVLSALPLIKFTLASTAKKMLNKDKINCKWNHLHLKYGKIFLYIAKKQKKWTHELAFPKSQRMLNHHHSVDR